MFILNGEIKTFELFGTPSLFKKAHGPILESFLTEAAVAPKYPAKALEPHQWELFVKQCLTAPRDASAAGWATLKGDRVRGGEFKREAGSAPTHGGAPPALLCAPRAPPR
ncbi:MAG: hypothetical protein ACR2HJ_03165 [Fimbriimonadales bacterium]